MRNHRGGYPDMSRHQIISAACVSLALLAATSTAAQDGASVGAQCNEARVTRLDVESVPPDQRATLPQVLIAAESAAINAGQSVRAIANIRRAFAADEATWPDTVRHRFDRQADSLVRAIVRSDVRGKGAKVIDNDFFQPAMITLNKYRLFEDADSLVFVDSDVASPWRRSACWEAIAIHRVVALRTDDDYGKGHTVFADRVKLWEAFHSAAYEPFPWERHLTVWLDRRTHNALDDLRPPRYQVILMHPGIGTTVHGSLTSLGKGDLRSSPTLWWELAGLVRYNSRYTGRFGASLLMSIPEDGGVGVGPMFHVSKYALAYVFQRSPETGSGRGLVLTLDLYKFITGGPRTPKPVIQSSQ